MSSHREAPAIAKDPAADSTDLYAFVSPDAPDTVTIIANYVPFKTPTAVRTSSSSAPRPSWARSPGGDDVLYQIHIDNTGTGHALHHLPVPVHHDDPRPRHVPLRHRADHLLARPGYSTRGTVARPTRVTKIRTDVARAKHQHRHQPARTGFACPPCNVGIRTTPNYSDPVGSGRLPHLGRRDRLRRPARRRLLRRPRLHLRPRRPAADLQDQLIPGCQRAGHQLPRPTRTCTPSPCRYRSAR